MLRIIFLGVFAVLAINQCTEAIDMGHCAQQAIAKGVPELGIPPHDPLVIPKNLTIHLLHFLDLSVSIVLSDLTWTNLPWWKVTGGGLVSNTSTTQVSNGTFWWDNFTISYNYDMTIGTHHYKGNVAYLYKDVTWKASWEEQAVNGSRKLNYLKINHDIASRSIKTSGFGLFAGVFNTLLLAISDLITEVVNNDLNLPGVAFAYKINKEWYGNATHYDGLVAWCKARNITTPLH